MPLGVRPAPQTTAAPVEPKPYFTEPTVAPFESVSQPLITTRPTAVVKSPSAHSRAATTAAASATHAAARGGIGSDTRGVPRATTATPTCGGILRGDGGRDERDEREGGETTEYLTHERKVQRKH